MVDNPPPMETVEQLSSLLFVERRPIPKKKKKKFEIGLIAYHVRILIGCAKGSSPKFPRFLYPGNRLFFFFFFFVKEKGRYLDTIFVFPLGNNQYNIIHKGKITNSYDRKW